MNAGWPGFDLGRLLSTGQVVFAGNFAAIVAGWSFGDDAFRQVAETFVDSLVEQMRNYEHSSAPAPDGDSNAAP